MNILILNWRGPTHPKAGGAEIVTMQHAKSWVQKGNKVTWLAANFPGGKSQEIIDGVEMLRKGNSLTVFIFAALYYFLNKKNIDVVVDEFHGIPFFTPLYIGKPKIAFIHEVADEIWDYMYPFPINVIGRFLETFYFPLYKKIQFWTDAPSTIAELGKYGIPRNNCIAIPCPPGNSTVTKLPVKEKNPTFTFVSRVVRMKGVEEVIKAFGFIHKENSQAQLWIVGRGEELYIKKLKQMANEYGVEKNIVFYGGVNNKEKLRLMGKAYVLLHASVKEGWGLVVVEAASQGTPSVVYNVPGLVDSVKNNITGIVLGENSPTQMAKEALNLVQDKARYTKFQKNGLEWTKSLSWDEVTKQSLILLQKVQKNG